MVFRAEKQVFMQTPGLQNRVLVPGSVLSVEGNRVIARFEPAAAGIADGAEFILYYEESRRFMKRPVGAREVSAEEEGVTVAFESLGDGVSAEGREQYRVTACGADISAAIGEEMGCVVLDAGGSGIAVWSGQSFAVGKIVDVELTFEGEQFAGLFQVQSVHAVDDELTRYGMLIAEDSGFLGSSLFRISIALQRQQLARLAGRS